MSKAIVTGLIARFPVGGNTWSYLQYVLGLKRLGYDVFYLEDSSDLLCYNVKLNATDTDCTYCADYLKSVMGSKKINMSEKWVYRVGDKCYGMPESDVDELCKEAELLVNVSGALLLDSWLPRRYENIGKKIFIDTDPAFTQFRIASDQERKDYSTKSFVKHDVFFTFGENIGSPDCNIPECGVKWSKTRQPIVLDMWQPKIDPNLNIFTTVMNWSPYRQLLTYEGEKYGQKDAEFLRFIDLPKLTEQKIELAMSGGIKPRELMGHGWKLVSGVAKERRDMFAYQRYIQNSRAEWSVAKNAYVKTRCGWFSERSACYLASAKPVLVQDTGFSKHLPTGKGLLAFDDMEGVLNGINEINSDYVSHCEEARQIAEKYFDSDIVLKDILHQAGL